MAQKSKKKQRRSSAAPRAVKSDRREVRASQEAKAVNKRQVAKRQTKTIGGVGERPESPFGFPLSEILIFIGLIAIIIGFVSGGAAAMAAGGGAAALGVGEVTYREHRTGFRPHASLLSAFPAVAVMLIIGFGFNVAGLIAVVPGLLVGVVAFYFLRKQFKGARQRRVVSTRR